MKKPCEDVPVLFWT